MGEAVSFASIRAPLGPDRIDRVDNIDRMHRIDRIHCINTVYMEDSCAFPPVFAYPKRPPSRRYAKIR